MDPDKMTDEELLDAAKAGTLTPEQEVAYYVRLGKMSLFEAREIVYTDWDQLLKDDDMAV